MTPAQAAALIFDNEWRYRIEQTEASVKTKAEKSEVEEIKEELKSVRRALIALMSGILASAVLVSLTLLATVGTGH